MSNLEDTANAQLTEAQPTDSTVRSNGASQLDSSDALVEAAAAGEGSSTPSSEIVSLSDSSPAGSLSSALDPSLDTTQQAIEAHLAGIPNALPLTWCRVCQADVLPVGKGKCPRCAKFLKNHFVSRKKPVNVLRRTQVFDTLVAYYKPATPLLTATCADLAGVREQLESIKPGSTEHQRLVQLSQTLGAALEESKREAATAKPSDVLEVRRTVVPAPHRDEHGRDLPKEVAPSRPAAPDIFAQQPATPTATVRDEPICRYGCGSLVRCAEIKAMRLDMWRALHFLDPDEVRRRDEEATEEMRRRVGKTSPLL